MESHETPSVDVPLKSVSTFVKDFLKSSLYVILSISIFLYGQAAVYLGDLITLILGIVFIVLGAITFMNNLREVISSLQYRKAENLLGHYLKGVKPVCPYLKVSARGFNCLLEFSRPFDIKGDLPRCHNEELSKLHWVEKAPQVFEELKVETGRKTLNYIAALGNAKYSPAIPYLVNMLKMPKISKNNSFLLSSIPITTSISINDLERKYIDYIQGPNPNIHINQSQDNLDQEVESANQITNEFKSKIKLFEENNFITIENDNVTLTELTSSPNFFNKWKLYNSDLIKQYTLASLGLYENEELIPHFLEYILNSSNKKMIYFAKNALRRQKEKVVQPIIDLIQSDSITDEQKMVLLETCGLIQTDEMFNYLKDFISTSGNELYIAYAISSIGKFGDKGNSVIMDILADNPDELILETGRASLAMTPKYTFDLILEKLKSDDLSEDLVQILISVMEDLDYKIISKDLLSLPEDKQDEIIDLFEKYDLDEYLDLFLPENI